RNKAPWVRLRRKNMFTRSFTEHVEKFAVAVSCLDEFDTDEDKRTYLRSLISPPDNQDMAFLQKGIEDLSLRMESGFRKVYRIVEASSLSSGFVTETQLGKTVLDDGTEIAFPLNITESTKG
ncbi:18841_t:CDS:2, partial [Funneliformis geosporum]